MFHLSFFVLGAGLFSFMTMIYIHIVYQMMSPILVCWFEGSFVLERSVSPSERVTNWWECIPA